MSTTYLLTGASGFLGSHLLKRLVADGHRVIGAKRSTSDLTRLGEWKTEAEWFDLDRVAPEMIFGTKSIDFVVHCATDYGRKQTDPLRVIEANLMLPLTLLDLAARHGVKGFINTDTILDKGVNHYSLAKKQFSEWLEVHADRLVCVNVALEHFYGPGDDASKFVTMIIRSMLKHEGEVRLTRGEQKRDFIFIDDVISAFERILTRAQTSSPGMYRYEVGSGLAVPIRELVLLVRELTENEDVRLAFGAIPYRKNEVMESKVDLTGLTALGWAAGTDLREGLLRTIELERKLLDSAR